MEGGTPPTENWKQSVLTGWDGRWFMPKQGSPSLRSDYLAVAGMIPYPFVLFSWVVSDEQLFSTRIFCDSCALVVLILWLTCGLPAFVQPRRANAQLL